MEKIRVLLADDSALARGMLRDFLQGDAEIEIVGEACNGEEAVRQAAELGPDIITMDLEMPVMGGMEAIGEIMATRPVPILVVSSVADAQNACAAIAHGALDVVAKPDIGEAARADFIARIKMLSKVAVITHMRSRFSRGQEQEMGFSTDGGNAAVLPHGHGGAATVSERVVAIASSTGGTQALAHILGKLPAGFPSPILVSQHIADGFAAGMAAWLDGVSALPVHLAQDGEPLVPGVVYVSPSEASLAVTPACRVALLPRRPGEIYHPSCDALFNSVAVAFGARAIAIILTGMGRDGADGLLSVRHAGGSTLAQDEASSVVFGMNREAINLGAAQQVLPLERIAQAMCRLAVVRGGATE